MASRRRARRTAGPPADHHADRSPRGAPARGNCPPAAVAEHGDAVCELERSPPSGARCRRSQRLARQARASPRTAARLGAVSAEVGSSMIRMRASSDSALAISTSCCSPTGRRADRRVGDARNASPSSRAGRAPVGLASWSRRSGFVPRLAAEEDVGGHREGPAQVQLLMNRDDACGAASAGGERHRVAADQGSGLRVPMDTAERSSSAWTCRRRSRPSARGSHRAVRRSRRP